MPITQTRRVQAALLAALSLTLLCWGPAALAEPFHTVTIDGSIVDDGVDWAPADRIVNDFDDDDSSRSGNVRHLWLTWDEQNLYLGVNYQALDRTLVLYLDTGTGVGPNDATVFAESPRSLLLPEGRHADLMLSHYHGGFTDLGVLSAWRADDETGAVTDITASTVNAQTFGVDGSFPDKSVFWFRNEIAIPWSEVYPDGMPARAVLRAAAAVTAAADSSGADDAMPGLGRLENADLPIRLTRMQASIVDQDGDGAPDPLDAGASGTVTLPQDPGTVAVTVTATLTDWSGDAVTGPLSTVVTAGGVRDYRVGRLAAGTYLLSASAPGYFPAEQSVTVSAGQELAGVDFTLQKATTITGTLSLALGQYRGGYRFRDPAGAVLAQANLLPSQLPFAFTFYVIDSGTYTLEAWAANHLSTTFDLVVTAGEDLLGLDLVVPRAPLLSGTVSFNTGPGADGVVSVGNAAGDTVFATVAFTAGDPVFSFYAPRLGDLSLSVVADTYLDSGLALTAEAGVDQTGLVLALARQPAIIGTIAFLDGPGNAGHVYVTGLGDGAPADTLAFDAGGGVFGPAGDYEPFHLPEGDYEVLVDAPGYGLWAQAVTLQGGDTVTDLGEIPLVAVRADRMRLLDAEGLPIDSISATVSIDSIGFYSYAEIRVEAVGEADRRDLFDLDGKLSDLDLVARKLNDVIPPTGPMKFLGSPAAEDEITRVSFDAGLLTFWMIDETVEVLRVFIGPDVPDEQKDGEPITGRFMVGFRPTEPALLVLRSFSDYAAQTPGDAFIANGEDHLTIEARLYDSAGNENRTGGVTVTFSILPDSPGVGSFDPTTRMTNEDGIATTELTASGAGELLIDAVAVHLNVQLTTRIDTPDGDPSPLIVTALAGGTTAWRFALSGGSASIHEPFPVDVRLVDAYGNPTAEAGRAVQLTSTPGGLGAFDDPSPISGEDGVARTTFIPSGVTGFLAMTATSTGLAGDNVLLQLRDVAVVRDPVWSLEDDAHNSFDTVDLTSVVVDNTPEELLLDIPFASDWTGLQFHVIFETNWDEAGGSADSFEHPVNFGHAHKPDFVLNLKYDRSYGDLRRFGSPNAGWLNWWDRASEGWLSDWASGVEIQNTWADFYAGGIRLAIPWTPFGGMPDSLRFEVYVTQVGAGDVKRGAFDSVPEDATLDLDFDYLDPQPGDWDSTELPVTLSNWSPAYAPRTDFPARPEITDASVEPSSTVPGAPFTLRARVTDAGGGVGAVLADLSQLGGSALAPMYDDGLATHGDATAGDGIWSLRTIVPLDSPGDERTLQVAAYDGGNVWAASVEVVLFVEAQIESIVDVEDAVGDDHGPNDATREGMYYVYPTNAVFVTGAFDIERFEVYETVSVVNGVPIEMVAFAVTVGDLPNPADPFTADWNPLYGELNIQKLDILIDTGPGGATLSLPNRGVDMQPWNAWDYAVIIDGWYKALIPSLSLNSLDAWRTNALKTDADIQILGDFDTDVLTALVSKAALGNPSAEDIAGWGMAVLMSGHDFGGEEVLGGIRWVNEALSEWQISGGSYTDQDPNIMDLLTIPGTGRERGRDQEEILDYESEAALRRLNEGRTPCALDMSRHVDNDPPAIAVVRDEGEVVRRRPLIDAPVNYAVEIFDDTAVAWATFYYRSTSAGAAWFDSLAMGRAEGDFWTVDIPSAWIETLVASPLDGARYLEFQIVAADVGNLDDASQEPNIGASAVMTMQLDQASTSLRIETTMIDGDLSLRHVDGSVVFLPDNVRRLMLEDAAEHHPGNVSPDSLATIASLAREIVQVPSGVQLAPAAPVGTPMGVSRQIAFEIVDHDHPMWDFDVGSPFPEPIELTLHYTSEDLPAGRDEQKVAVYEYHLGSDRWVLVGGHVNDDANQVTVRTDHAGIYGLFWTEALDYDEGEIVSGITLSPNPFSPNDDGLYDQATLSFYLAPTVTGVTVEIYDIDGRFQRRLSQSFFGGGADAEAPRRVAGIIWDGRDEDDRLVPYGIYILRLIVVYNLRDGDRTIRSNHPVAVIR